MTYMTSYASGEHEEFMHAELIDELVRVLPKDHPLIGRVDELFERAENVIDSWMEAERARSIEPDYPRWLADLVFALDDWAAGIRTWPEVEDVLRDARGLAREVPLAPRG